MTWLFYSAFFVFLIDAASGLQAMASEPIAKKKEILIVIGYADDNSGWGPENLFRHTFMYDLAASTQTKIEEDLFLKGFKESSTTNSRFENIQTNVSVTVLNANSQCLGENRVSVARFQVCEEQKMRSFAVKMYLTENLNRYDDFRYIGHSRLGMGLGVGPFTDEFTFDLKILNLVEAGFLKKIVLGSCNSQKLYQKKIPATSGILFKGTPSDFTWDQDIAFVLNEKF